jgi:4-hydroxybenzoate polyprenyltransferase
MLDDRERRILADLERELTDLSLPKRRLPRALGPPWWPLVCGVLGVATAVFLITLGLVGNAVLLLAVAVAPLALRLLRHHRRPPRAGPERPV